MSNEKTCSQCGQTTSMPFHTCRNAKYEKLAQKCFSKSYFELDLDDRILIEDLYNERNE